MRRPIFRVVLLLAAVVGLSAVVWGRVRPVPHRAGMPAGPSQEVLRAREIPSAGPQHPAVASAPGKQQKSPAVRVTPGVGTGDESAASTADPFESGSAPRRRATVMASAANRSGNNGSRASARRPVPPASFLAYRADTVEALAHQAETDPRVRARYARHFGIPASQVAAYIRQNLVVSYLPQAGRYTVYYVNPGGRIYSRRVMLPQGTRVLTLRNGEPVMRWICGNAMVPQLPRVAVREIREAPPAPPVPISAPMVSVPGEQVAMVSRAISVPVETVTSRAVPVPPVTPPTPAVVTPVPAPVTVAAVPVVPVTPITPVTPPVTPVVPIVPPIVPVTPVTPPVTPVTELPPPEVPIPEADGLVMLALSSMPVAWSMIRGRRRRQAQ